MSQRLSALVRVASAPCALAGGALGAAVAALMPGATGLPGLIVGWLYGIVVGALMKLFRMPAGAYPLSGALCGPLPFALLMPAGATEDERGLILLGIVAGALLGLVEWAHGRWRARAGGIASGQAPAP